MTAGVPMTLTDRLVQRFEDEARHRGRPPRTLDDHNLLKAFARLAMEEQAAAEDGEPASLPELRAQLDLVVTGVYHSLQMRHGPGQLTRSQRSRARAFCAELGVLARQAGGLFQEPTGASE